MTTYSAYQVNLLMWVLQLRLASTKIGMEI